MPNDGPPNELLRARMAVHEQMLVDLWSYVLAEQADAVVAAGEMEQRSLAHLDETLDAAGEGGTAFQAAGAAWMETMWSLIKADLADLEAPTDLVPTAYGLRLHEQLRRGDQTSREEPSADGSDGAPDR